MKKILLLLLIISPFISHAQVIRYFGYQIPITTDIAATPNKVRLSYYATNDSTKVAGFDALGNLVFRTIPSLSAFVTIPILADTAEALRTLISNQNLQTITDSGDSTDNALKTSYGLIIGNAYQSVQDTGYYIGNSITAGVGASAGLLYRYSTVASRLIGVREINLGLSSSCLQKGTPINPIPSGGINLIDRLSVIPRKTTHRKFILIELGINDVGYNGGNYDTINYKRDYRIAIDTATARGWPSNQIFLSAPGYADTNGYNFYAGFTGNPAPTAARHLQYVDATLKIALEKGCVGINMYDSMFNHGASTLLSSDGLHPNDLGHIFMGGVYANVIGRYSASHPTGTIINNGTTELHGKLTNQLQPSDDTISIVKDFNGNTVAYTRLNGGYPIMKIGLSSNISSLYPTQIDLGPGFSSTTNDRQNAKLIVANAGGSNVYGFGISSIGFEIYGGGTGLFNFRGTTSKLIANGATELNEWQTMDVSSNYISMRSYGSSFPTSWLATQKMLVTNNNPLRIASDIDLSNTGLHSVYLSSGGIDSGQVQIRLAPNAGVAIGKNVYTFNPTAYLHLKQGTGTAGTSPIKLTSGTLNTVSEKGAFEYLDSTLYYTPGSIRYRVPMVVNSTPSVGNVLSWDGVKYINSSPTLLDTASISNRINSKVDSFRRVPGQLNQQIKINGSWITVATDTLTPATSYVQNQGISAQTAGYWINGFSANIKSVLNTGLAASNNPALAINATDVKQLTITDGSGTTTNNLNAPGYYRTTISGVPNMTSAASLGTFGIWSELRVTNTVFSSISAVPAANMINLSIDNSTASTLYGLNITRSHTGTNTITTEASLHIAAPTGTSLSTARYSIQAEGTSDSFANAGPGSFGLGAGPAANEILGLYSTTKGFRMPLMTSAQMLAITGSNGLSMYNTTTNRAYFYRSSISKYIYLADSIDLSLKADTSLGLFKNLYSTSAIPTVVAGTGAGTTPTVAIETGSTNSRMKVSLTLGTTPAASATIATITLSGSFAYPTNCKPVASPGNEAAATLSGASQVYCDGSAGSFTIKSNTVPLTGGPYIWYITTGN